MTFTDFTIANETYTKVLSELLKEVDKLEEDEEALKLGIYYAIVVVSTQRMELVDNAKKRGLIA